MSAASKAVTWLGIIVIVVGFIIAILGQLILGQLRYSEFNLPLHLPGLGLGTRGVGIGIFVVGVVILIIGYVLSRSQ